MSLPQSNARLLTVYEGGHTDEWTDVDPTDVGAQKWAGDTDAYLTEKRRYTPAGLAGPTTGPSTTIVRSVIVENDDPNVEIVVGDYVELDYRRATVRGQVEAVERREPPEPMSTGVDTLRLTLGDLEQT